MRQDRPDLLGSYARAAEDVARGLKTGAAICVLFALVAACAIMLNACSIPQLADRQADLARAVCGPDGAVDWDDNPSFPPPHCNRDGWDGHRYRSK